MGRDTQGMTAVRLKGDDEVVGMEVVEHLEQQLLVVTEQGFGKRTDVADFPIKHRATGGVIANSLNNEPATSRRSGSSARRTSSSCSSPS